MSTLTGKGELDVIQVLLRLVWKLSLFYMLVRVVQRMIETEPMLAVGLIWSPVLFGVFVIHENECVSEFDTEHAISRLLQLSLKPVVLVSEQDVQCSRGLLVSCSF